MFDPKYGETIFLLRIYIYIIYVLFGVSETKTQRKKKFSHGTKIRGLSIETLLFIYLFFYILFAQNPKANVCVHFLSDIINNTSGVRLRETFSGSALQLLTKETNEPQ